MKYMLLIYGDEAAWTEEERQQCYAESTELAKQLQKAGKCISTAPLHSVAFATSVRIRDGKTQLMDGPFAETREQLGGYYMIEAANLDEAISIAAQIPAVTRGTVEVRPVVELPGLPT
jgi:hypothetical protein